MKPSVWTMKNPRTGNRTNGLLILLLFLFFIFYIAMDENSGTHSVAKEIPSFYVMVEGDVKIPGVYSVLSKDDLAVILDEAGVDDKLDISGFIKSESKWESGTSIKVGKNGNEYHLEKGEMSGFQKITLGIPVNINKESVDGLTAIPGIGNSLARTINEERIKRNGFRDISELKTLHGIGDKLLAKVRPYIRL
jgi:competence protein ComEA